MANKPALALPDQLIVRYFRADELDQITRVTKTKTGYRVQLGKRTDHWTDLGGGLGYVPVTDAPL